VSVGTALPDNRHAPHNRYQLLIQDSKFPL
jgi:hypothetical protein